MARIERTNEKYNRAKVKEILRADQGPPEACFDNAEDMLAWLNDDPRRDCPWKCRTGDPKCLCASPVNADEGKAL